MTKSLLICLLAIIAFLLEAKADDSSNDMRAIDNSNECHWINDRKCPDSEVRFYLYTRSNAGDDERQLIHIDDSWEMSNLSSSFFMPKQPSKIIIHGFRSDMFLTPLIKMKSEYLERSTYNVFFVDWFNLSSSICYPAVVHNIKHVGECTAQLVNRIRDAGGVDIHVIGFSLGAQVANYVANSLKPDYLLPRITGLDPALPLFVMAKKEHKLDPSDALFVDVFHCNGLMQGQIERTGNVDFYMNGGIYQPGCGTEIFSCSHVRCPNYFMESIRSNLGFHGWQCQSYFHYVLGLCPFTNDELKLAGEDCDSDSRGLFLVKTNSIFPYAKGKSNEDFRATRRLEVHDMLVINEGLKSGKFREETKYVDNTTYLMFLEKLHRLEPKVLSMRN